MVFDEGMKMMRERSIWKGVDTILWEKSETTKNSSCRQQFWGIAFDENIIVNKKGESIKGNLEFFAELTECDVT